MLRQYLGCWAVGWREGDLLIPDVIDEELDTPEFLLMNEPESLAQGRQVRDVAILKRFCWMLSASSYIILYARDEDAARKVAVGVMAGVGCFSQHQGLN